MLCAPIAASWQPFPAHCRARPELRPDIRSTPFRGYVIFFRYTGDQLEVINILNAHKDIAAHFEE